MTVKMADLKITKRQWPILVATGASGILHISDSNGTKQLGLRTVEHYIVTRCNRALHHPWYPKTTKGYKLCSRCGTEEDFLEALADYQRLTAEEDRRRCEEDRLRMLELDQQHRKRADRMEALCDMLTSLGLQTKRSDTTGILVVEDMEFHIKEKKERKK